MLAEEGGFDPELIMLEAYADRRPRDPDAASPRERAVNRRVEVRLVSMSRDRVAAGTVGGGR